MSDRSLETLTVTRPRALGATPLFWFSMLAASALGTNLGDLPVDTLSLGETTSFALLAAIAVFAIWGDSRYAGRTEAAYWIAIVTLRAAATNVGDFMTHDLRLGYLVPTVVLGVLTLGAGAFTRVDAGRGGTPLVDGRYWAAMLVAGVFGTIGGDMAAHSIGRYTGAVVLTAVTVAVIVLRNRFGGRFVVAYWCVVLAERAAGTPLGDSLASRHAAALGPPLAMVCTGAVLAIGLLARSRGRRSGMALG